MTQWPWPEEQGSLEATPQPHKRLSENDLVCVIYTCIPPDEVTEMHTHKWPAYLYVVSWPDFTRYNKDWVVTFNSPDLPLSPLKSTVIWSQPLKPLALRDTGKKDLHIISTEIKKQKWSS